MGRSPLSRGEKHHRIPISRRMVTALARWQMHVETAMFDRDTDSNYIDGRIDTSEPGGEQDKPSLDIREEIQKASIVDSTKPKEGELLATLPELILDAQKKALDIVLEDSPDLAKGLKTPCYKWQDKNQEPRGAVLLIHGFPAHGKVYDNLARKLAAEGMVVYAPDMRGLGRAYTSGLATQLDYVDGSSDNDLAVLAKRIRDENPGLPLMVGGESMGGVFSIRLAALHPEMVDGLILSGAAIKNVPHYMGLGPQALRNLINPNRKIDFSNQIRRFFSDDPRIIDDLMRDPLVRKRFDIQELTQCRAVARDTVPLVGRIKEDVPVLLLQSVNDMQTPYRRSMRVYDHELRSKDFTPVIFPPRGHILIESPYMHKDVEDTVLNWIRKKVP